MSFWKGRGDSVVARKARNQDSSAQSIVKSEMTLELAKCVKCLQEEHLGHQSPILSSDTANAICNVLEAIFMHGFKGDLYSRTFWPFLTKFTHGDVVSQISQLSQINSEIGMCRAWVRMALNDGLVESYVDAILGQPKTASSFYDVTAYLRDSEQPEIMKGLLAGLMDVEFRLSYNSSVLNDWAQAPFLLSGLLRKSETPIAVVVGLPATEDVVPRLTAETTPVNAEAEFAEVSPIAIEKCQTSSSRKRTRALTAAGASSNPSSASSSLVDSSTSSFPARSLLEEIRDRKSPDGGKKSRASSKASSRAARSEKEEAAKSRGGSNPEMPYSTVPTVDEQARTHLVADPTMTQRATDDVARPPSRPSPKPSDTNFPPSPPPSPPSPSVLPNDGTNIDIPTPPTVSPSAQKSLPIAVSASSSKPPSRRASHTSVNASPLGSSLPERLRREPHPPQMSEATAAPLSVSPGDFRNGEVVTSSAGKPVVYRERRRSLLVDQRKHGDADVERRRENSVAGGPLQTSELPQSSKDMEQPSVDVDPPSLTSRGCNRLDFRSTHGWSSSFDDDLVGDDDVKREGSDSAQSPKRKGTEASFVSLFQDFEEGASVSQRASPLLASIVSGLTDWKGASKTRTIKTGSTPDVDWPSPKDEIVCGPDSSSIPDQDVSTDDFEIIDRNEVSLDASDPKVGEHLRNIGVIANELGLDFQDFKCGATECGRMIGMIYGKARVCTFTGRYYCHECHENDEAVIPARMIQNWDFRKHKISKFAKRFLAHFDEQPILNVKSCNPKIYSKTKPMQDLLDLRTQLCYLKSYLFTCKQSVAEDLRLRIWPHEYLFDHVHLYSPRDLRNVHNGSLTSRLKKIIDYAMKHVYSCLLCKQKGFICEICNNDRVIYPFEMASTCRCENCTAVYHRACRPKDNLTCVKCERIRKRNLKRGSIGDLDHGMPESIDFIVAPEEEPSPQLQSKITDDDDRTRVISDAIADSRSEPRSSSSPDGASNSSSENGTQFIIN